jgi:deoxyadenosine/deoxycytidine kinase
MKLNAYSFQSFIMDKMNDKLIKEQNFKSNNIIESSIIANESFVRTLNKDGFISNDQESELSKIRIEYLKKNPISNIIYLTSKSTEQELERIKKRGRVGENYTIKYLEDLNNAHKKTIEKYKTSGIKILEIKNDSDELNQKNLNKMCEEICNFLMQ